MSNGRKQSKAGPWEPRIDDIANRWIVQNLLTLEVAQTAPRGKSGTMDRRFKAQDAAQAVADKLNVNATVKVPLDYKAIAAWAVGPGTGSSSKCIAAHLMGLDSSGSYPGDGGDFARCERLLEMVPGLRERLPEMASCNGYWAALVPRWEEIRSSENQFALIQDILRLVRDSERNYLQLGKGVALQVGKPA